MTQARFSRRLGFLALLAALSFAMTLPALALFDQQAPGEGAPIAQAFSLTTYRDVAVSGTFTGVDPQGEPLTFRVTENPARGSVTLAQEGSARFTYTPYENKTGKDTFAYVAVDPEGNVSQPAEVSVEIRKPRTGVTYADLAGHPAHKAAITLAEEGIFVGEQLGETWFFHPEAEVSREDFLAMAMDLVGLEALPEEVATGFADDQSISSWARPYVAAALQAGMVQGTGGGGAAPAFAPQRTITQTESAGLLDRLLQVADVADTGAVAQDAAPAWAWQSVVNLEAVGVLEASNDGETDLQTPLTREKAAEMLQSAKEVLDFRESFW